MNDAHVARGERHVRPRANDLGSNGVAGRGEAGTGAALAGEADIEVADGVADDLELAALVEPDEGRDDA